MTEREAAIVTAYTGHPIGHFSTAHKYINTIMNREVFNHEFAMETVAAEIKKRSKNDFVSIKVSYDTDRAQAQH